MPVALALGQSITRCPHPPTSGRSARSDGPAPWLSRGRFLVTTRDRSSRCLRPQRGLHAAELTLSRRTLSPRRARKPCLAPTGGAPARPQESPPRGHAPAPVRLRTSDQRGGWGDIESVSQ
ncbi:hypothetical protein I79_016317 [Cricetulus griseus]|uniref:Uncharacterized protein n=1 Tax=Cricetulus griseus TaxID=10029 RepID=G3HZ22_CRIGR|nr:hypothetical protein I79_016317 [Cricetulus griseus]